MENNTEAQNQTFEEKDIVGSIMSGEKTLADFDEPKSETSTSENTDTTTTQTDQNTTTTDPKTDTQVEQSFFEKRGFKTEAEFDAYLESSRTTKPVTYSDKTVEELDNFVKATGIKDLSAFNYYKNTEVKETYTEDEYIDLIVDKALRDNPELSKLERSELIESYKSDYKLDVDAAHADTKEKIAMINAKAKLKSDAEAILTNIKEVKEKMSNGGLTQADIAAETSRFENSKKEWSSLSENLSKDFKLEIKDFEVNDKGEQKILDTILKSYTFEQDNSVKEFFKTTVDTLAANAKYPNITDDIAADIQEGATILTVYKFLPKLLKEAMAQTEARVIKEKEINRDNPSATIEVAKTEINDKVVSEKTAVQEAMGLGK